MVNGLDNVYVDHATASYAPGWVNSQLTAVNGGLVNKAAVAVAYDRGNGDVAVAEGYCRGYHHATACVEAKRVDDLGLSQLQLLKVTLNGAEGPALYGAQVSV